MNKEWVYLLDSVVLIDILNTRPQAKKWISSVSPSSLVISVVTLSEVLVGIKDEEQDLVKSFLNEFPCLSIDPVTAEAASRLRRQFKWKLMDAFQAALALEHKLTLITRNSKDFNSKVHPFVKTPYSI